jgi:hypothetical protein
MTDEIKRIDDSNFGKENAAGKSLEAITTVYSYRFPVVRAIIDKVTTPFPHDVFLRSTSPPGALDNFHEPIIERVLGFYSDEIPAMRDFNFRYPTSGSEEGIREVMTTLQTKGVKKIYVFDGEYEGYKAVGESRGIETINVKEGTDPRSVAPGYWFISNPSAKDGNIIENKVIEDICEAGHKVFYDLAYLGSTRQNLFDVSHPNIFAAVVSFSKPYGLFYDRIGFTFSREAVPALYGNKWFKSILGLMIADKIVKRLRPGELYDWYRPIQENIISGINYEHGLGMRPSDALLLGYRKDDSGLDEGQKEMISKFRRGPGYRFCLTPYYFNDEKWGSEVYH